MRRSLLIFVVSIITLSAHASASPKAVFMGAQNQLDLEAITIAPDNDKPAAVQLARLQTGGRNGDLDAQARLGIMYYLGVGVPMDWNEAQAWFRKAAARGRPDAQLKLGVMCFMGQGTPRDLTESLMWFRKASEQGETAAQACLGAMYAEGLGVSQDLVEAYAWLLQARSGGDAKTASICQEIGSRLTPSQIKDGIRRALEAVQIREKAMKPAGE